MFIYILVLINWYPNEPTKIPNIVNIKAYDSLEKCQIALPRVYYNHHTMRAIKNNITKNSFL
ncbi:MAG: hypothetical protein CMJ06_05535 [Pelagibacterales bacterium]|nr:hypothetical protein [Pelagibacterales bacterium]OUU61388.1 MAG: hypothetical protein CBC22_07600 [Alphaproteobacteria bacterium TMED62]